ncbi:hypothetical protein Tco_1363861, partial [Tanacetum coccineum]
LKDCFQLESSSYLTAYSNVLENDGGLGMVRDIVLSTGIIDRMCKVGKVTVAQEMEGDSCMLSKKPNTRSCGVDDNSKVNSVVKLGSTMSEDSIDVLPQDGAGISLNIANHEPHQWSHFQKLARDDLSNKDASHIDESQLAF